MKNIKEIRKELEDCIYESKQEWSNAEKIRIRVCALRAILMSAELEIQYSRDRTWVSPITFFDCEDSEEL